ncbi:MAG: histidinol dehydrogenase, partial [Candidatus Binatia bacterium]
MSGAIAIFRRGDPFFEERLKAIAGRGEEVDPAVEASVREIVASVRAGGDAEVLRWTARFDGTDLGGRLEIPKAELRRAESRLDTRERRALGLAARRIAEFHRRQSQNGWRYRDRAGLRLGQKIEPLERVG